MVKTITVKLIIISPDLIFGSWVKKDHLNLIKAIKHLFDLNTGLKLRIILAGKYFIQDDYYQTVLRAIQDYNFSEFVELIGEVINVSDILYASDIAVLCSQFEGLLSACLNMDLLVYLW